MEVQLYVYDLSNGLAKQVSLGLLGKQIDAIYHTSIVLRDIEYVYDGGIRTVKAGTTHLGRPMNIVYLGVTELPFDVVLEYLDSLREIYTIEAYELWTHNCNNFTNDFATFLLGHGIPAHISNLPDTVLNTPFGRMLKPYIDGSVRRQQAANGGLLGIKNTLEPQRIEDFTPVVSIARTSAELDAKLAKAEKTCAVVFFTSPTCAPCKALYPMYQELASEEGKGGIFVVVDISKSPDLARRYHINATPTLIPFLYGEQLNPWLGGSPNSLKENVHMLQSMAERRHPHLSMNLTSLQSASKHPILFKRVPPMDKLKAKMGPVSENAALVGVMQFITTRAEEGAAESTLPDLDTYSHFMRAAPTELPPETMFPVMDIMRVAMSDVRFSGYYAEEKEQKTVATLLSYVSSLENCPYPLLLTTLQLACNLFTSPLYPQHILTYPGLREPILELITSSLLDSEHHSIRVAASSLALNMADANCTARIIHFEDVLPEDSQIELAAALLEAIGAEETSVEALRGFLLALGFLAYCMEKGDLRDMLFSMEAKKTVQLKGKLFPDEPLVKELDSILLSRDVWELEQ